ncbi:MAG: hypothetical protein Kow00124_30890 [Anaerolineae bacterium]
MTHSTDQPSGTLDDTQRRPVSRSQRSRFWRVLTIGTLALLLVGAGWLFSRPLTRPYRSDAALGRGFWHYNQGRYGQAINAFDEAIRINPQNAAAYYNRGQAQYDLGNYEAALADFSAVIALHPDYPWVYEERGQTYLALERYEEALADFDHMIALKPQYALAYFYRAQAHDTLGDVAQARADYARFLELYGLDDVRVRLARARLEALGGN